MEKDKPKDIAGRILESLAMKDEGVLLRIIQNQNPSPDERIKESRNGTRFRLLPAVIEQGWLSSVLELIKLGADVNQHSVSATPLMLACASKAPSAGIINALISKGADLNARAKRIEDMWGETPLMLAAQAGNTWAVRRLLQAGADPALKTPRGQTAIFFAVSIKNKEKERLAIIRELAAAGCPLLGNELHYPVYERNVRRVNQLLKLGCPVNLRLGFNTFRGPRKGSTPLVLAAKYGGPDFLALGGRTFRNSLPDRIKIIRLLLEAGADPNQADAKGIKPLSAVIEDDDPRISQLLIDAGAIGSGKKATKRTTKLSVTQKTSSTDSDGLNKNQREFYALWNK